MAKKREKAVIGRKAGTFHTAAGTKVKVGKPKKGKGGIVTLGTRGTKAAAKAKKSAGG